MFSGATAFQAKFKCTNADTGPASSCAIPNYDQYYILAQNTCESEGYVTILNLNQCRIAGRALSGDASKGFAALISRPMDTVHYRQFGRTGGCTFHSGNVNNNLQFFPFATGPCGLQQLFIACAERSHQFLTRVGIRLWMRVWPKLRLLGSALLGHLVIITARCRIGIRVW